MSGNKLYADLHGNPIEHADIFSIERAIKLKIDPSRKKWGKLRMPPKPIERSRYAQQLFEIGAGWNE